MNKLNIPEVKPLVLAAEFKPAPILKLGNAFCPAFLKKPEVKFQKQAWP